MTNFAALPFDIVIFLLRLAFVFLLYFFVFQVTRTLARDLRQARPVEAAPNPYGQAVVVASGTSGLALGTSFNLTPPIVSIGRKPTNAIVLDDNFVSGEHALLTWRDGRWWAEDYKSTNSTILNGAELSRATPVLDGDILTVGGVQLRIVRPPAAG